ncbi:MAG TPA: hypothetical protein VMM76_01945 [Pirellulaceae bacterium]|nr:hypothetical protein [Pirellulaceae bacterium]
MSVRIYAFSMLRLMLLAGTVATAEGCNSSREDSPAAQPKMTDKEQEAWKLVEDFIAAHESWERQAYGDWKAPGTAVDGNQLTPEGLDRMRRANDNYAKTLSPFFVPGVEVSAPGWGSTPVHASDAESVESAAEQSGTVIIRTKSTPQYGTFTATETFEYTLKDVDGTLRIDSIEWTPDP